MKVRKVELAIPEAVAEFLEKTGVPLEELLEGLLKDAIRNSMEAADRGEIPVTISIPKDAYQMALSKNLPLSEVCREIFQLGAMMGAKKLMGNLSKTIGEC